MWKACGLAGEHLVHLCTLKKKLWPKKLSDTDRDKEKIEGQILKWQDIEFN